MTERTTALLPVHIFGYPADLPAFERMGLPIVEDACEALGAVHGDGVRGRRARPSGGLRLLRQQAADDRRGRDGHRRATRRMKERIDSERNQGRAPDMGWLDHDRLGFNYRLTDIACAVGQVQLAAWTACSPTARGWPAGTARRWRGVEGLGLPCEDAGGDRRGWFVFVVQVPRGRDRDEVIHALRAARRAVQALPAGHPPHELLPRALRPSRGRVPGLRGRRRAVGRAAVLPGHDRGPGRNGWPRRWRRRSARVHNRAMASLRADAERARRRRARRVGAVGFAGAAALPIVLWHRVIADIAGEFRLDAQYLITGWSPWVLMALGLLCFVPVVARGPGATATGASTTPARAPGWGGPSRCTCSASPSPPRWPRSPMA